MAGGTPFTWVRDAALSPRAGTPFTFTRQAALTARAGTPFSWTRGTPVGTYMGIHGKQLQATSVANTKLEAGILSADATGRALMVTGFFDAPTASSKFAAASLALALLAEPVVQADGGQAFTADQSMGGFKLTGLGVPTNPGDAASKSFVEALVQGLDIKASVRVATNAALPTYTAAGLGVGKTITMFAAGVLTIDGVATVLGDRVLVKDEAASHVDHGIYEVTTEGTAVVAAVLTRATDADADVEVTANMYTFAEEGIANADSGWTLVTNDPVVVDTTAMQFTQFSGAGAIVAGNGLTKAGNTIDVGATSVGVTINVDSIDVIYGGVGGITTVNAGDAAVAGVANTAARGDHQHAVSTGVPGSITPDDAAAEGAATSLARSDHTHAIVAAAPVAPGAVLSEGVATSFSRSDHVHTAPTPTAGNKDMTANTTTVDGQQGTATAMAATPAIDSYVRASVNGVGVAVGDGVKTKSSYFSNDGGTTARAIAAIASGDTWHWNGSIAGYELSATTDVVDFDYAA